jgi:hypothetical protein
MDNVQNCDSYVVLTSPRLRDSGYSQSADISIALTCSAVSASAVQLNRLFKQKLLLPANKPNKYSARFIRTCWASSNSLLWQIISVGPRHRPFDILRSRGSPSPLPPPTAWSLITRDSLWRAYKSYPSLQNNAKSLIYISHELTSWLESASEIYSTERPPLVGEVSANFCG